MSSTTRNEGYYACSVPNLSDEISCTDFKFFFIIHSDCRRIRNVGRFKWWSFPSNFSVLWKLARRNWNLFRSRGGAYNANLLRFMIWLVALYCVKNSGSPSLRTSRALSLTALSYICAREPSSDPMHLRPRKTKSSGFSGFTGALDAAIHKGLLQYNSSLRASISCIRNLRSNPYSTWMTMASSWPRSKQVCVSEKYGKIEDSACAMHLVGVWLEAKFLKCCEACWDLELYLLTNHDLFGKENWLRHIVLVNIAFLTFATRRKRCSDVWVLLRPRTRSRTTIGIGAQLLMRRFSTSVIVA